MSLPRRFIASGQVAWVLLAGSLLWGAYGYWSMPQRKDPEIPVQVAVAVTLWPGASADKVEQLVTRRVEEKIAENATVERVESISRGSLSVVYVWLDERIDDPARQFDDIKMRLDSVRDLPPGAGPIDFIKDFGDTAALMLTVASPKVDAVELAVRASPIRGALEAERAGRTPPASGRRVAVVAVLPEGVNAESVRDAVRLLARLAEESGTARDAAVLEGPGFVAADVTTALSDEALVAAVEGQMRERLRVPELHPDVWPIVAVENPADTEARLAAAGADKYSYRQLDEFSDLIKRTLQNVPSVSKVTRTGILGERVLLEYEQGRMASYGVQPAALRGILGARNVTFPGGQVDVQGKTLSIEPSGEFDDALEIGDVVVAASPSGAPVYLRDLVEISRGYESPPRFLNFHLARDAAGSWQRGRAVTLAVQMRPGMKIGEFGEEVDRALASLRYRLPPDLVLARTSDQPRQVSENVALFMSALGEAIGLVVLVALVGFWAWRPAALIAISIPLTLALTFGVMHAMGIDLQQISIGALIVALGLLVDVPVVSGDAIQRELDAGRAPRDAAWIGPTRLARAMLFATITNIVAYLPLLVLTGNIGRFLYSLPMTMTASLLASILVAMTFIPLIGIDLVRPGTPLPPPEIRRQHGFAGHYFRIGRWAIRHRWRVLVASFAFLALGAWLFSTLKVQFFPKDLSYLSYVDVWLPEDAPLAATNAAAARAERIIAREAGEKLKSVTTFVGGGGPRFWFSVSPELRQLNYAQLVIEVKDKHDTASLVAPWQRALAAEVPGARIDVRQLETGKPVGVPVAVRITGDDPATLRRVAARTREILLAVPTADRVRDDWGAEAFSVKLEIDPDRASLTGLTNQDVALSSALAMSGLPLTTLRQGDEQIPVLLRLKMDERARLEDVKSLYVYSLTTAQKAPLGAVARVGYAMETEKIRRRNQFPTITVSVFPVPGVLPSEVLAVARPALDALARDLPPGTRIEIGGEEEEQVEGFRQMGLAMALSVVAIYLALVLQFRHAVKPLIVFAAIPYGMVGAVALLAAFGAPFGFMAFLGVASLIGVIVSHVIVLFDFIEEARERGEPLEDALLDAGVVRLRPVLITVGATVFGLVPLAVRGGPLWVPMCLAQIGGLTVATVVTLVLVPVIYAIAVEDLRVVSWEGGGAPAAAPSGDPR